MKKSCRQCFYSTYYNPDSYTDMSKYCIFKKKREMEITDKNEHYAEKCKRFCITPYDKKDK